MKYSASTNGFYIEGVHTTIPNDAIEISNETHTMLIAGQTSGQRIIADNFGYPVLADPLENSRSDMILKIVHERERRLSLGFDYDFGDARGVHRIGTTEQDMVGWDEVTKATQALCALGFGSAPITIVTNTGPAIITAIEWQQILVAATQFRQPLWAASFALQAMDPIPDNYDNNIYWP